VGVAPARDVADYFRTPGVETVVVTGEPGSPEPDASPSESSAAAELPAFLTAAE